MFFTEEELLRPNDSDSTCVPAPTSPVESPPVGIKPFSQSQENGSTQVALFLMLPFRIIPSTETKI